MVDDERMKPRDLNPPAGLHRGNRPATNHAGADSDRPSHSTLKRRRQADIDFIANVVRLREAKDLAALIMLEAAVMIEIGNANDRGSEGPTWKLACVYRAMKSARR